MGQVLPRCDSQVQISTLESKILAWGFNKMQGIQFVVDEADKKQAVLIDLSEWGELWEDFYDVLVAHSRQDEEEVTWEALKLIGAGVRATSGWYCHFRRCINKMSRRLLSSRF